MWVKICANTRLEDARLAAELGADAVGFVFAESRRRVTAEQVGAMTRELPVGVEKVGVFTSTDAEEILRAAGAAGLTVVQLHSAFDPALVEAMVRGGLRVLQVVDVVAGMDAESLRTLLRRVLAQEGVMAALLDAAHGGASGGTGTVFDWSSTAGVVREVQAETGGRVIVAGGLRAENVCEAIAAFAPWGVDVASGVEASYGVKDAGKVRAFLEAAKGAG
jgi:phosphoribosylanthranilate isomerase